MKKSILLILLFFSFQVYAKHIGNITAQKVASSFYKYQAIQTTDYSILETIQEQINGTTTYYVFNFNAGGFVMVAADDAVSPILGYSLTGKFDKNNLPPNANYWFGKYSEDINQIAISNTVNLEAKKQWEKILDGNFSKSKSMVSPLCTTKWDQGCYFNELCPYDTLGSCNHATTGCVATAMAQIMKKWNYPATGSGTHSYLSAYYGTLSADFGNTNYQWPLMVDSLAAQNIPVATLMYHCGVSVDMIYGPGGSGAYVIPQPFFDYFKYSLNAKLVYTFNYDSIGWINMLKSELDASRPVLYAGFPPPPMPTGHAWVCDGYDNNDFFHFNWGWSGNSDGYFSMFNFVYSEDNHAIIQISPPIVCDVLPKQLISPVPGVFTIPETIQVKVANYDTIAHSNIPISYIVDGGTAVLDTITSTIPPLSDIIFQFQQPYNFYTSTGHVFDIKVITSFGCDLNPMNDTLIKSVEGVLACETPPYSMNFENPNAFIGWEVEDVNNDSTSWSVGQPGGNFEPTAAFYFSNSTNAANDFLISKCINLEASKVYKLSYWYKAQVTPWAEENLKLYIGNAPNSAAMVTVLQDLPNLVNVTFSEAEVFVTVPTNGSYYFGWKCYSDAYMSILVIDDINITEVNLFDAAVTEKISPNSNCDLTDENIIVKVRNYCSTPIINVPISYSVNGGSIINEIIPGPIAPASYIDYTFATPVNLSASGTFNIKVFSGMLGDTIPSNDTISFDITNIIGGTAPFTMGFEPTDDFFGWQIENTNNDSYSWNIIPTNGHSGTSCLQYPYSSWDAADDWVITKCMNLQSISTYKLSFWYKAEDPSWPEKLKVNFGTIPFSANLTTNIIDLPNISNTSYLEAIAYFTVPANGVYYLGWKCYSPALMFNLYLDDINITDITVDIPQSDNFNNISVYPNPAKNSITITGVENYEITILNVQGQILKTVLHSKSIESIDVSEFADGLYFLILENDNNQIQKKIEVQH